MRKFRAYSINYQMGQNLSAEALNKTQETKNVLANSPNQSSDTSNETTIICKSRWSEFIYNPSTKPPYYEDMLSSKSVNRIGHRHALVYLSKRILSEKRNLEAHLL